MRDPRLYLAEMLAAADAVEDFVKGMEFDAFLLDDKTSSAVVRKFEIIGEASKNISSTLKERYPEIPWKEMAGMRDKVIHLYFGVDREAVWLVVKERIPSLKPLIEEILRDLEAM